VSRRITHVAAVLTLLALHPSCADRPSTAADRYIANATDSEEREALTLARDDIDEEQRALVAQMDAEIERLRKENEALRKKLRR
jgi:hypothetical protein